MQAGAISPPDFLGPGTKDEPGKIPIIPCSSFQVPRQRYREDVPSAEVEVLDAGHLALDTAAEIASLIRQFVRHTRGKREKLLLQP